MCEYMAKFICHARRLKCDDVRLKSLSPCNRVCSECDMYRYVVENVRHMVMQCPIHEGDRILLYQNLYQNDPKLKDMGKCCFGS